MRNKILIISIAFLCFKNIAYSQYFDDKSISNLTILQSDSLIFLGDSLIIDTLIMFNDSKIIFSKDTYLVAKNSIIGQNVMFDAKGADGSNGISGANDFLIDGEDGRDSERGKSLLIIISFNSLGSLLIDTGGGNGGNGGNGISPSKNNVNGEKGLDGGRGGNGGKGKGAGNIMMYYVHNEIAPRFNRAGPQSIHLLANAGKCGKGGVPGKGGKGGAKIILRDPTTKRITYSVPAGADGLDGQSNNNCHTGADGEVFFRRIEQTK